ncbi:YeiH family protein [Antrihabitans cavernicola]|uniref:Putative sulfate exporter family transporter n=1 Tax=Antrihabitans cavernicola TaxID=2495913 RepID=A0A5A7SD82_9NOCA|nr:putative sulfate exporter family transporter [Spelaeibacter cavernicola]KAA0022171.1 putative sulfate exporter family transporter [Spelaeibacter cavernicola]
MSSQLSTRHTINQDRQDKARGSRLATLTASLTPGLALCAIATAVAMAVNSVYSTASPLLIAIVLGAILANVVSLPQTVKPGLQFSAKKLLRVGVALLGFQLMLSDILALGWGVIVVVVAIVCLGITGTMFAGKLLGLTWTQRLLIACGFSICGAAAVAAVDGVVDADEEELLTAVALVVIFGTLMIPVIPLLARLLGMSDNDSGMWAGGAIHEVAQVVAAGGAIGGSALAVAVVVKLARVLMLAPVMTVLSVRQRRLIGDDANIKRPPLVPLFVIGFIACVVLRSTGAMPSAVLADAKFVQTALLTAAMFALGAGVHVATIKKVGPRPFVLATISTAWVATIALIGVTLAG